MVGIYADTPPEGQEFDQWTGDVSNVDDVFSKNATVNMPEGTVSLTATYKDITYDLVVNNGTGTGTYISGEIVNIVADPAPQGQVFNQWTGDIAQVAQPDSAVTTITVNANTTITATYTTPVSIDNANKLTLGSPYPNPTSDWLIIPEKDNVKYSAVLKDNTGKIVGQWYNLSGKEKINCSHYTAGIYLYNQLSLFALFNVILFITVNKTVEAQPLIENSSFETGDYTGWTVTEPNKFDVVQNLNNSFNGEYFLRMKGSRFLETTVTNLKANTTYKISIYGLSNESESDSTKMKMYYVGESGNIGLDTVHVYDGIYKELTGEITTGPDQDTLTIGFTNVTFFWSRWDKLTVTEAGVGPQVPNNSFENGDYTGWTVTEPDKIEVIQNSAKAYEGEYSLQMKGSRLLETKVINLKANTTYTVSIYGKTSEPESASAKMAMYYVGESGNIGLDTVHVYDGIYKELTAEINTGPEQDSVIIGVTNVTGFWSTWDLLSIKEVIVPVEGVSLDQSILALEGNATSQLTATVNPENASDKSVTWSSSDTDVAMVDENGLITAISEGTATITVKTNDGLHTASCDVTVTIPVSGVTLDYTELTLDEGSTSQLTATVNPENASDKSVTWSSSDTDVASVDENGLVTAVSNGTATITVTTNIGDQTATCEVTVNILTSIDKNWQGITAVYPLPVKEVLNIDIKKAGNYTITLMELSGQIVYSNKQSVAESIAIPVNHLLKGMYIAILESDGGNRESVKFIKQ
ncbi:MAG: T9SS type A sorting domain-containing protein [Bacteroidetes bacterium]|jgi:uncharacterized protein YjdB|nr:T9SS type A sorting domain-containing protein [Bacteroidota bacterium]